MEPSLLNDHDILLVYSDPSLQMCFIRCLDFRDILKADANVVDLHKLSKFFYEFGKKVAATLKRGSKDLLETLIQVLFKRYCYLLLMVCSLD